jgi:hypothetical protein
MHDNAPDRFKDTGGDSGVASVEFSQLITEFDAADSALTMAYGRYMEKPSPRRMRDILKESEHSFDAFSDVIQRVMEQEFVGTDEENSRPITFATLLVTMSQNHSRLLAEHTDFVEVSDEDEARDETLLIAGIFEGYDDDALVEAVLDHFKEMRENDMEAIERFIVERKESPYERLKEKGIRGSVDVAKIGSGVFIGMTVYEKLFSR